MSIKQEHAALLEKWLLTPPSYIDYDGTLQSIEPDAEDEENLRRVQMLEDLMNLNVPIWETEWGMDMHYRMCPCPGRT